MKVRKFFQQNNAIIIGVASMLFVAVTVGAWLRPKLAAMRRPGV